MDPARGWGRALHYLVDGPLVARPASADGPHRPAVRPPLHRRMRGGVQPISVTEYKGTGGLDLPVGRLHAAHRLMSRSRKPVVSRSNSPYRVEVAQQGWQAAQAGVGEPVSPGGVS